MSTSLKRHSSKRGTIPAEVRARAGKAGDAPSPTWYAGRVDIDHSPVVIDRGDDGSPRRLSDDELARIAAAHPAQNPLSHHATAIVARVSTVLRRWLPPRDIAVPLRKRTP
ncbi:hypothetical protein Q5424_22460 [Conexibacter sp. JD483]|uniref:hypothetical protein n=1 Tax=unclassified Conexibacter TaxID=2627773 RepID=UPI0027162397|nr:MULTISPECIES: hypothetical protein [unclassified Conexibacter]MDO8186089.1 hypothetical protein [Conexibacter sp. CPCC 205706]MDO8199579.1 hypothetical protein [Conexibacter sp. CPCC 205762]MDR9371878.1 hypothetical protein [Conexibacter sp. JD483]